MAAHEGPSRGDEAPDLLPDRRLLPRPDIRDACPADAPAIARILNQGIDEPNSTLEVHHRSPEERAEWMASRGPRHPVIVAFDAGEILGWASLNAFKPRPAYDHVADISVYVARESRGQGVGRLLLDELDRRARSIGFHKLVLAAMPENAAGVRLYTRCGFTTVGFYHEQGFRDGVWRDVLLMEKLLA